MSVYAGQIHTGLMQHNNDYAAVWVNRGNIYQ
mgnify:FL=1